MKAKGLMIGNLLEANGDWGWETVEVTDLSEDEILHTATGSLGNCNDECRPIPLTEEWLVKFGLTKRKYKHTYKWSIYGIQLLSECNGCFLTVFDIRLSDTIESVHRLQNLYFALTGEELTIKR